VAACRRTAAHDPLLQQCLLAYVLDYHLIATALRPHEDPPATPGITVASIDHGDVVSPSARLTPGCSTA
jgi:acyl-CoA thioesterase